MSTLTENIIYHIRILRDFPQTFLQRLDILHIRNLRILKCFVFILYDTDWYEIPGFTLFLNLIDKIYNVTGYNQWSRDVSLLKFGKITS